MEPKQPSAAGIGRTALTGGLRRGDLRFMGDIMGPGEGLAEGLAVGGLDPNGGVANPFPGSRLPRRNSPGLPRRDDVRECECDRGGCAWSSAACISAAGIGTHFFLPDPLGAWSSSLPLSDEARVFPPLLFHVSPSAGHPLLLADSAVLALVMVDGVLGDDSHERTSAETIRWTVSGLLTITA